MTIDEIVEYVMNTPDNTNERVLRDMLNQLNTGEGLPEVTSSDNGDVLTVVDGAWDKAAPMRIIEISKNGTSYSATNITVTEIEEIVNKHIPCAVKINDSNYQENIFYAVTTEADGQGTCRIYFQSHIGDMYIDGSFESKFGLVRVMISNDYGMVYVQVNNVLLAQGT